MLYVRAKQLADLLTVTDEGLHTRKAKDSLLLREHVVFRTGKVLNDRFYIISVGCDTEQVIIDAYDKERE